MRRITALLAAALATSLVAVPTAPAAAPVHDWVTIDETFTWTGCGFPVEEHDEGTLHFISWFNSSGVRTRQIVLAPGLSITYTNPDTGASVSSQNPYVAHKTDNPDGSTRIAFTGLVFAFGGYVTSGREVIVFDDGNVVPVSYQGPSTDLCEALAATIA